MYFLKLLGCLIYAKCIPSELKACSNFMKSSISMVLALIWSASLFVSISWTFCFISKSSGMSCNILKYFVKLNFGCCNDFQFYCRLIHGCKDYLVVQRTVHSIVFVQNSHCGWMLESSCQGFVLPHKCYSCQSIPFYKVYRWWWVSRLYPNHTRFNLWWGSEIVFTNLKNKNYCSYFEIWLSIAKFNNFILNA